MAQYLLTLSPISPPPSSPEVKVCVPQNTCFQGSLQHPNIHTYTPTKREREREHAQHIIMNTFITTFNCGKIPPLEDQFYTSVANKCPRNPCDLYVFGFQELSSILDGTLVTKIHDILNSITAKLIKTLGSKYTCTFDFANISYFGTIGLIIISPHADRITNVVTSKGHPVGHLYTNLKGGVGLRITYNNIEITFVVMHLNAGENLKSMIRRNNDLYEILSALQFTDNWCVFKPNTHCFIMGDLNYRMTGGYGYAHTQGNGFAGDSLQALTLESHVDPSISSHDELSYLRKNNIILPHFDEPPVHFKPTYKYYRGSNKLVPNRVPSYCDRILFVDYGSHDTLQSKYDVKEYDSITNCLISDHVPVYMIVSIPQETPKSVVDHNGYLLDQFTGILNKEQYFKNQVLNDFALVASFFTTNILKFLLSLIHTKWGNLILVLLSAFLLYRFNVFFHIF